MTSISIVSPLACFLRFRMTLLVFLVLYCKRALYRGVYILPQYSYLTFLSRSTCISKIWQNIDCILSVFKDAYVLNAVVMSSLSPVMFSSPAWCLNVRIMDFLQNFYTPHSCCKFVLNAQQIIEEVNKAMKKNSWRNKLSFGWFTSIYRSKNCQSC